jgi:orotate phosphoribosyltransferase-like protein
MQGCEHTTVILNNSIRRKIIDEAINSLSKISHQFDTIVCCGTSGLLVVPQICESLRKNILVVRKKKEQRYSPFAYEGAVPKNYIIVDDLICSGSTIKHILNTIEEDCDSAKCLGVYIFLKDKCSYNNNRELCKKQLGIEYL